MMILSFSSVKQYYRSNYSEIAVNYWGIVL
jgi:hypothetical protein